MKTIDKEGTWVIELHGDGLVYITHMPCNFAHHTITKTCWYCNKSNAPLDLLAKYNFMRRMMEM